MSEDLEKQPKGQNGEIFPKEIQAIIAGIFPNMKYFDSRFDYFQVQIDELRRNQEDFKFMLRDLKADMKELRGEMKEEFERVDARFAGFKADVDRRFEQVDKRLSDFKADVDRLRLTLLAGLVEK